MDSEPSVPPRFFYLEEDAFQSRCDTDAEEVEPVNLAEGARCPRCGDPTPLG
jgi:hypothetical protein